MTLPLALVVVLTVLALLGAAQLGVMVFAFPAAIRAAQRRARYRRAAEQHQAEYRRSQSA